MVKIPKFVNDLKIIIFPNTDVSSMNILTKLLAMKKTFIWALSLLPLTVFSQQNSPVTSVIDARLYEAYDKAHIDKVAQDDPFLLKRWTYYLDHAYYVTDAIVSKDGVAGGLPLSICARFSAHQYSEIRNRTKTDAGLLCRNDL